MHAAAMLHAQACSLLALPPAQAEESEVLTVSGSASSVWIEGGSFTLQARRTAPRSWPDLASVWAPFAPAWVGFSMADIQIRFLQIIECFAHFL